MSEIIIVVHKEFPVIFKSGITIIIFAEDRASIAKFIPEEAKSHSLERLLIIIQESTSLRCMGHRTKRK
jgi:hypothetical protein